MIFGQNEKLYYLIIYLGELSDQILWCVVRFLEIRIQKVIVSFVISRSGNVNWSPRSCDLTPLGYFFELRKWHVCFSVMDYNMHASCDVTS